jgi:hypothetical protein
MIKRKIGVWLLVGTISLGSLSLTACGNSTTLSRVGSAFQQVAKGFQGEIESLKASGLLSADKAIRLEAKARGLNVAADALANYLNGLSTVNANNKAEVASEIAKATSLLGALLQNPDVLGLSPDTLLVKILNWGNITLQQAAIVLAALNPPPATPKAGPSSGGIPTNTIKIKIPPVPKGAEKYAA